MSKCVVKYDLRKKDCLVVHYSVPEFSFTLHFVLCNDEPYSDGQFTNQPPSLSVTDCTKKVKIFVIYEACNQCFSFHIFEC